MATNARTPGTSVMAFNGPVVPGKGIPSSRPRGRVCAVTVTAIMEVSKSARANRMRTVLSGLGVQGAFAAKAGQHSKHDYTYNQEPEIKERRPRLTFERAL